MHKTAAIWFTVCSAADWQPVVLPQAEQIHITAANGREYRIQAVRIGNAPPQGYPVLYVLDGDVYFAAAAQSVRILFNPPNGNKPRPLLLVGIGYRDAEGFKLAERAKDLTPPLPEHADAQAQTEFGGADSFARLFDNELPSVLHHRFGAIDPQRQALFGHSYGGLFAAYMLTHDNGRYSDYFISSPSLWWQNKQLFTLLPSKLSYRPQVRVSYGSQEAANAADSRRTARNMQGNAQQWHRLLQQRGVSAELTEYSGENHGSAAFAALHDSLKTLRDRWY